MVLDLTNVVAVGMGAAAFFTTITAVFLFVTAPHERLARILGYAMSASAVWAWCAFAYYIVSDPWVGRELGIISTLGQIVTNGFVMQYAYVYLSGSRVHQINRLERVLYWSLMSCFAGLAVLTCLDLFGTEFMVARVSLLSAADRLVPQQAPFAPVLVASYMLLIVVIPWIMSRRIAHEKGSARRVGIILAMGMVTTYLLGSTGFLTWFGITGNFTILQGFALPAFIVVAFYTITNYRLFNVRVAAAEVFIFAMWGFLFWRLLLHTSLTEALPDIFILVAVITLGLLMIRNVTQELANRIELEEVSEKLRVLNISLESKVATRTKELARSQEHIEQVVEHLPVGLIEVEADGKIVRINDVAQEFFAVKEDEVVGTGFIEHPPLALLLTGQMHPGLFDAHIETPQARDLEVAVATLSLSSSEGFIIIIRDVTEKRALEHAKNDFVATAAHQLRTPLAAIKWTFELLKMEESFTAKQKEALEVGVKNITEMERVEEGLMGIARKNDGTESAKNKVPGF